MGMAIFAGAADINATIEASVNGDVENRNFAAANIVADFASFAVPPAGLIIGPTQALLNKSLHIYAQQKADELAEQTWNTALMALDAKEAASTTIVNLNKLMAAKGCH